MICFIIRINSVTNYSYCRYEITDITPDRFISEAMDQQAAAERERRKKVIHSLYHYHHNHTWHFQCLFLGMIKCRFMSSLL
jgi:hypothetical protein